MPEVFVAFARRSGIVHVARTDQTKLERIEAARFLQLYAVAQSFTGVTSRYSAIACRIANNFRRDIKPLRGCDLESGY